MDFASEEIKPIVLVGPYEHHSNLLPWREIGATVSTRNSSSVWRIFQTLYILSLIIYDTNNIISDDIYGSNNIVCLMP